MSGFRRLATSSHVAKASSPPLSAEREFANLDTLEVEVAWVARCLTDFAGIWDVLTPENRGRLLHAVIQRVEVNEPGNQVTVFLADIGADVPAETASQPAQQEVRRDEADEHQRPGRSAGGHRRVSPCTAAAREGLRPSAAPGPVRRPARVAVMLALAHKIQDAIDRVTVRDRTEVPGGSASRGRASRTCST